MSADNKPDWKKEFNETIRQRDSHEVFLLRQAEKAEDPKLASAFALTVLRGPDFTKVTNFDERQRAQEERTERIWQALLETYQTTKDQDPDFLIQQVLDTAQRGKDRPVRRMDGGDVDFAIKLLTQLAEKTKDIRFLKAQVDLAEEMAVNNRLETPIETYRTAIKNIATLEGYAPTNLPKFEDMHPVYQQAIHGFLDMEEKHLRDEIVISEPHVLADVHQAIHLYIPADCAAETRAVALWKEAFAEAVTNPRGTGDYFFTATLKDPERFLEEAMNPESIWHRSDFGDNRQGRKCEPLAAEAKKMMAWVNPKKVIKDKTHSVRERLKSFLGG